MTKISRTNSLQTPVDEEVVLLENKKINAKYYRMAFRSKALAKKVEPGQFLQIKIESSLDPFLRRPFSYYGVQGDRVELLYEILGRGTALLAQKKSGDRVQVLGPLGREFTKNLPKGTKRVLVAGGVGVPPLLFLAEKFGAEALLVGVKSKAEVLPKSELARSKAKIFYASNDGSYGTQGFVTVLLESLIKKSNPENLFIQTCGPTPMMEAVLKIALREGVRGEISIDKPMACGVGACLGCMVKTRQGWTPSCTEGPVFSFDELDGVL